MSSEQQGIVTMYTKTTCPHCAKAKELLEETHGLTVTLVDIESEDQEQILQQMRQFSGGRNTVPQVFFNENHLGGNDDVQQLQTDGKLAEKVEMVKNTPVTMMQEGWYHPWY
jgi:glutaredoxin 3